MILKERYHYQDDGTEPIFDFELINMDKQNETKSIEKWLQLVDKPLVSKNTDERKVKIERKNQTRKKE